jgi:type III restriction enzyme
MPVVAQDTVHANALQQRLESDTFFEGRYRGKVLAVHSNVRGEEKDEVVQQLLTVEQPDNPIEIVIHVNMLKEGWDVTNLYTIVPLRAANSRTLVEQFIGRGLRLPYGKRVGIPAVDRLTIVFHDRFQEIIDHANDPTSIIRAGVVIGKDIADDSYEPDFVVETHTHKFLCEPKRANDMTDPDVVAKAEAASIWCRHASEHARESGGKPWTYLLIPHDQIAEQMTLAGLAARYTSQ